MGESMRYENKALRDTAKGSPCMIQLPECNNDPSTVVWCHSNQARHGHGKGIKGNDFFGCWGCSSCHFEIDQGTRLDRFQKQAAWQAAFERTLAYLWQNGLIQVTGSKPQKEKQFQPIPKILPRNKTL